MKLHEDIARCQLWDDAVFIENETVKTSVALDSPNLGSSWGGHCGMKKG